MASQTADPGGLGARGKPRADSAWACALTITSVAIGLAILFIWLGAAYRLTVLLFWICREAMP